MNYSVVRIPVNPVARKFYEKRYSSRKNDRGYIALDKNHAFGMKIIHYMDVWFDRWEIPKVGGSMLKISLPKSYMNRGIVSRKLIELQKVLEAEAMEFLVHEIACAASFPGVSVTNAIITVMARYDISEDEYRSDSMRRHFDRYCEEVMGEPFHEFSYILNASIKRIYERMVQKYHSLDDIQNDTM